MPVVLVSLSCCFVCSVAVHVPRACTLYFCWSYVRIHLFLIAPLDVSVVWSLSRNTYGNFHHHFLLRLPLIPNISSGSAQFLNYRCASERERNVLSSNSLPLGIDSLILFVLALLVIIGNFFNSQLNKYVVFFPPSHDVTPVVNINFTHNTYPSTRIFQTQSVSRLTDVATRQRKLAHELVCERVRQRLRRQLLLAHRLEHRVVHILVDDT